MMIFGVRTNTGTERKVSGTNIIPGFPTGTIVESWMVNGTWFRCARPVMLDDDGELIILFERIRFARENGAPRTYKGSVPNTPPPINAA
jgi:hypothetical protein